jgi:predicted RNA binding protein YcfA (HicA-like mRNA interferase family)
MARVEKLIEKMRNRPNGIRFNEIVKVLESNGYIMVRVSGSHHHFRNEYGDVITIPKHNPVKAVYVEDVLKRIGE